VEVLRNVDRGSSYAVLRRAKADDIPAIVNLIAADQLGAARDGVRTAADLAAYQRAFRATDQDPARERGCALVQLTTDKSRTGAHRFYERPGFVASHEGMKLALPAES